VKFGVCSFVENLPRKFSFRLNLTQIGAPDVKTCVCVCMCVCVCGVCMCVCGVCVCVCVWCVCVVCVFFKLFILHAPLL